MYTVGQKIKCIEDTKIRMGEEHKMLITKGKYYKITRIIKGYDSGYVIYVIADSGDEIPYATRRFANSNIWKGQPR